ncbi:MAG: hypothetical protein IKJ01_01935 [Lachnospiraceae bacterium]|nr:hypothetical protein [Lachnospiraceae bacterium]
MEEKKIRFLRADEIECRVASVNEKGVSLLLYKDARVDQSILDETFGIFGWQRKHEKIGDALFCSVSIRTENGEWITKQDVGTESLAEPIKGMASDSFKRACFNIGIGRELYSAPFIWVSAEKVNIQSVNGKFVVKDRFAVSGIQYDEERAVIIGVEIQNQRQEIVYSYGTKPKVKKQTLSIAQKKQLAKEIERTGISEEVICRRYKIGSIQEMNEEIFERAMDALRKTKSMVA